MNDEVVRTDTVDKVEELDRLRLEAARLKVLLVEAEIEKALMRAEMARARLPELRHKEMSTLAGIAKKYGVDDMDVDLDTGKIVKVRRRE